jgi:hypothetical protein
LVRAATGEKRRTGLRHLIGPGSHGRKTQNRATPPEGSGQAWEKKRKTDSEKDRSELLILFEDCEHKATSQFSRPRISSSKNCFLSEHQAKELEVVPRKNHVC